MTKEEQARLWDKALEVARNDSKPLIMSRHKRNMPLYKAIFYRVKWSLFGYRMSEDAFKGYALPKDFGKIKTATQVCVEETAKGRTSKDNGIC